MQCLPTVATYNIPLITNTYIYNTSQPAVRSFKTGKWPNCTSTVVCGQPPAPPVNGTITWITGTTNQVKGYFLCEKEISISNYLYTYRIR